MMKRSGLGLGLGLIALILSACGGGGSSTTAPTGTTPPAATVVSGVASKGPIKSGTVKLFAIRNGAEDRSAPLGQAQTDNSGSYTIDAGTYRGPVLVEVTGGSYVDEVTGAAVTVKTPFRAVFSNVSSGTKTIAVTPLTEMAYKKATGAGPFTAASINDANAKIATFFNLTDIVGTVPVAGGTSDNQKKYAFVLGAFAQLVNDNKNLGETADDALTRLLTQMGDEARNGTFSYNTISKINSGMTRFATGGNNQSGTTVPPPPLPTAGLLKLGTAGTASTIGAIDMTLVFPAGLTLAADPITGEVTSGVVTPSGDAAAGSSKLVLARFTPAATGTPATLHVTLINATGFGTGEFATVKFDVASGGSFPASVNLFPVTAFSAMGLAGTPLVGITGSPTAIAIQ